MNRVLLAAVLLFPLAAGAQTLRIAVREDADMMDPSLGRTFGGRVVFAALCDKLFDIDDRLQIVPQLATGYDYADPKTLILHLRPGVRFHDGTPMDADAVRYTLNRHLTMPGSARRSEIDTIDHMDALDPLTLRVVLKTPSAAFLSQLTDRAGMVVSPKAAETMGRDFGLHPVCAGPFQWKERVPQDRIVLDRFPDYWNAGAIHFDHVVYRPIADGSVRLANLQAGALDIVEAVLPTDAETVRQDPRLKLVGYDGLGYQSIIFNVGNGPNAQSPIGRSALVRRAFDAAIDRKALIGVVYNGLYPATAQGIPASSPFHDGAVPPPERDVAKAKALLQQAGVAPPVPVNLVALNSPDGRQQAEVIQAMTAEAGFAVRISAMEAASSLDNAQNGGFEAYMLTWSGRADPDGNLYLFLHTGGSQDYAKYDKPEMDHLLDAARIELDEAKRKQLYAQVVELSRQDMPISYIFTTRYLSGMSTRVQGFHPVPDGIIRLQGMSLAP